MPTATHLRHRAVFVVAALLTVVALGSCSKQSTTAGSGTPTTTSSASPDPNAPEVVAPGDIPDNQAFVNYTFAPAGYSVKVPEGWARTDDPTAVTFTDKYNSIRLEASSTTDAPTVDTVRATTVADLSTTVSGFTLGDVSTVDRPAGSGIKITYNANSAPNPVTAKVALLDVERYEFFHNGNVAILTLSGAHGADNVDPWKTVTDSLAWS